MKAVTGPGDGVPAPLVWRRSNRCDSGACVEVAVADSGVAVRDSKEVNGPILTFASDVWSSFVAGVREGDFDCK
jgi:Domain of unknown function (DUF397)